MENNELKEQFKQIYLSDTIFSQHFDSMNMIGITVVLLQITALILGILLKVIFNISSTWTIFVTIYLLVMEIISTIILRKNWEKAKNRLRIYHKITKGD